jgi:hypothetical protein
MECAVCYCNQARCKLICKHSFCKSCVKDWYYASEEPSCPMCRGRLYFKGMYKVVDQWEQERFDKKNEESFAEVFDSLFEPEDPEEDDPEEDDPEEEDPEEEDPEEEDPEGEWNFDEPDYRLEDIQELQSRFSALRTGGFFIEPEFLGDYYTVVSDGATGFYDDDCCPKNLFVSKHKGTMGNQRRCGARVLGKLDAAASTEVLLLICV